MDDKEFPELFTRLGYRDVGAVKNAAGSMVTKLQEVPANVAATGLREQYAKNDLGNLIADVNYALKRLVKGMNSENHAVKKGFFLALVEVLKAFHANVDEKRLITYIVRESKITASMKPQEANAAQSASKRARCAHLGSRLGPAGGGCLPLDCLRLCC